MEEESREFYLNLMKRCLTNYIYGDSEYKYIVKSRNWLTKFVLKIFNFFNFQIIRFIPFDEDKRIEGRDWPPPPFAHSMIGLKRLDNIQFCVEDILCNHIPGDLIEAGIWRGGGTIFMRAVLKAYGANDRMIWAADSFEGLPTPKTAIYPHDKDMKLHKVGELAVPLDVVKRNFTRYGLLDENVKFIIGWFSESLPNAPIDKLALIRIDADMYESTMDVLVNLYPKLSIGGYLIVDDYGDLSSCKQAVDDFRDKNSINEQIKWIDQSGIYWKKQK